MVEIIAIDRVEPLVLVCFIDGHGVEDLVGIGEVDMRRSSAKSSPPVCWFLAGQMCQRFDVARNLNTTWSWVVILCFPPNV